MVSNPLETVGAVERPPEIKKACESVVHDQHDCGSDLHSRFDKTRFRKESLPGHSFHDTPPETLAIQHV